MQIRNGKEKALCKHGKPMKAEELMNILISDFHMDLNDPRFTLGRRWKDLAGEKYAEHTAPTDIKDDVLFVKADHPVWVQMLQLQQRQILQRVNKAYPSLRLKRIRVLRSK